MKKQNLRFKVDGGLEKLSTLYSHTKHNKEIVDTYFHNPSLLLQALSIAPTSDVKLSSGYKQLADKMDNIDFDKWHTTFEPKPETNCLQIQEKPFASLWHAVSGEKTDKGLKANNVVVIVITITVTVTVTSGYTAISEDDNSQFAKAQLANMSRHAQTVAEQISWYS